MITNKIPRGNEIQWRIHSLKNERRSKNVDFDFHQLAQHIPAFNLFAFPGRFFLFAAKSLDARNSVDYSSSFFPFSFKYACVYVCMYVRSCVYFDTRENICEINFVLFALGKTSPINH